MSEFILQTANLPKCYFEKKKENLKRKGALGDRVIIIYIIYYIINIIYYYNYIYVCLKKNDIPFDSFFNVIVL